MRFGKNFIRYRYAIYLHGVPERMSNPQGSYEVISSRASGDEQTSKSEMENFTYNYTLTYGTCEIFGSLYSFRVNVYGI